MATAIRLTIGGIDILGLQLYRFVSTRLHDLRDQTTHTEPAVVPSWEDLPFTVKVTLLGATDLTSKLATRRKSTTQFPQKHSDSLTRVGVIEVLVQDLNTTTKETSAPGTENTLPGRGFAHITGRFGNIGERRRSSHGD